MKELSEAQNRELLACVKENRDINKTKETKNTHTSRKFMLHGKEPDENCV